MTEDELVEQIAREIRRELLGQDTWAKALPIYQKGYKNAARAAIRVYQDHMAEPD